VFWWCSKPSIEWLNIVKTSQAKNKIKAYFSKLDKNEAIEKGKEALLKEIKRRKVSASEVLDRMDEIVKELKAADENEVYIGLGTGKFHPVSVAGIVLDSTNKDDILLDKIKNRETIIDVKNDVIVDGIDKVKVTLANCCNPIKGDNIVGYISRGNGIIVHNENCHNIKDLKDRVVQVKWNQNIDKKFKTVINITCTKKENMLFDVINKTSGLGIVITKVNTTISKDNNIFEITIEVKDLDALKKYIADLKSNNDVLTVERVFY